MKYCQKMLLLASLSVCLVGIGLSGCVAQGTAGSLIQQPGSAGVQGRTGLANSGSSTRQEPYSEALKDPSKATLQAPAVFQATFVTSKGEFTVEVTRAWAPNGADRFYNMCKAGFFKDIYIFRAIKGFMFQFGVHGDPSIAQKWSDSNIQDDKPAGISNLPGTISFAQTGRPNSRSSQMFINLGNNAALDRQAVPFIPFGKVVRGMNVVNMINTEYGENPRGENIQGNFMTKGNAFIKQRFPNLDYIKEVKIKE